jgi:hypothetical protein
MTVLRFKSTNTISRIWNIKTIYIHQDIGVSNSPFITLSMKRIKIRKTAPSFHLININHNSRGRANKKNKLNPSKIIRSLTITSYLIVQFMIIFGFFLVKTTKFHLNLVVVLKAIYKTKNTRQRVLKL